MTHLLPTFNAFWRDVANIEDRLVYAGASVLDARGETPLARVVFDYRAFSGNWSRERETWIVQEVIIQSTIRSIAMTSQSFRRSSQDYRRPPVGIMFPNIRFPKHQVSPWDGR